MTRGHPEALTSKEGELAQRVDVQLHAEPQRGADECGAHVVLACCASTLRNPARGSRLLVRVRDRPFGLLVILIFLAAPPVILTRVCGMG